ncbi:hypothetical protein OAM04_03150 [bacterium]|nr:hypothetical protein [bacterium]
MSSSTDVVAIKKSALPICSSFNSAREVASAFKTVADYAEAITGFSDQMGIRSAVSPRDATRRDLMRFVTSDRWHLLQKLDAGELIESAVTEGSVIDGKRVSEVDWPVDCILVALLHGVRAMVPAADDPIKAGDHLYAVVSPKAKKRFLKLVTG